MAQPPKTRQKLGAVARAELNLPRTCNECGETKPVTNKNYTPFNKGLRGWANTCRVCQGVRASERTPKPSPEILAIPSTFKDDITEMYFLAETNRNPGKMDEIAQKLGAEVRRLYDAGKHLESLRLFIDCVKPLVAGWMEPGAIHDDILDGLLSNHRRRLIIATRYSAKSTLTGLWLAWRIFLDPLIKIMVVSRGSKLADRMLRTVRRVLIQNCPMLHHLKPIDDCLDNSEQFQTPQSLKVTTGGATMTSLGVTSNLPGYRADLTVGDDVEGPKEDTPEKVMELEEVLNELHMINPKGEKVMLGTYQSEYSVYARLADKATAEGESIWELHRACMFEEDPDDKSIRSRWPGMFSDKDGEDWRKSVTQRAWRLHAMLVADPSILNERPLKISDFILVNKSALSSQFHMVAARGQIHDIDVPTWSAPKGDVWYRGDVSGGVSDYAITIVAIDPASGLAGRDAIGVAVLGVTPSGFGVVRHLEGVRGPSKGHNMRRCAEIIRQFGASHLIVEETEESFWGDTLEAELILVGYPMSVEKVKTGGVQKGKRIIDALAPPMGAGRLIMLESVARSDHGGEFVNQLVRISYDGRTGKAKDHDDIVDALAHAVARVKGSLVGDIAENLADHSAERLDRLRYVPSRYGGLGGNVPTGRSDTAQTNIGGGSSMSLGELLIEEDENLIRMETIRERLNEVIQGDLRSSRQPDPGTIRRVQSLTRAIQELKETVIL